MKNRTRIASTVIAAAFGLGALGYALRTAPMIRAALFPAPRRAPGAATDTGAAGIVQHAFLTTGGGTAQGFARTVSLRLTDGRFAGRREYAYYGYVKVEATVRNGRLTDVNVLEYPNDNGRSHYINNVALPYLVQEAVDAQSANVDLISGATFTSEAFRKSLAVAMRQAGA
jgi:uncharacterized protein with FMN-binding domain